MEHRDVPAPAQFVEEVEQGPWPLGEFEAQHHFIARPGRVPTHHVANVQFGQLIVGQVRDREALVDQLLHQCRAGVVFRVGLHAHEDVRLIGGVLAVVELGDLALAHRLAEGLEATGPLRDGDRDDGFALFTQFCPLRDMAQAVEIDVRPGIDGDQCLAADPVHLHVSLDARHAQCPRRLGDRTGIIVDVLDRRADFVGADGDDFVHVMAADVEGVLANLSHRHAIGKQPDLRQHHPLTSGHGGLQAVGVVRFNANDLDFRAQVLHVGGDAGDQAAAADRHENRVQPTGVLAQDFHGHGALASNGMRIIVGVDVDEAFFIDQFQRIGQCLGERITMKDHFAAARAHAFDLDFRRGLGHHDGGLDAHFPCGEGQPLGMVASRGGDYAASQLFCGQLRQLVVGPADLEREHRLQVFALEQDLVAQAFAQLPGAVQGGFDGNVIDARGEDLLDVLFEHRESITGRGTRARSLPQRYVVRPQPSRACRYTGRLYIRPAPSRSPHDPGPTQTGRCPGCRRLHSAQAR